MVCATHRNTVRLDGIHQVPGPGMPNVGYQIRPPWGTATHWATFVATATQTATLRAIGGAIAHASLAIPSSQRASRKLSIPQGLQGAQRPPGSIMPSPVDLVTPVGWFWVELESLLGATLKVGKSWPCNSVVGQIGPPTDPL
jgi:hypothetical protein